MSNSHSAQQLADGSGVSPEIVDLIQTTLHPEKIICTPAATKLSNSSHAGTLTEAELRNYDEILRVYPELESIVKREKQFYASRDERLGSSVIGQHALDKETGETRN